MSNDSEQAVVMIKQGALKKLTNYGLSCFTMQVIAAEGEQKASTALRAAAETIASSPSALQLRYLQTLSTISAEKNSTIIFPIPINILQQFNSSSAQA